MLLSSLFLFENASQPKRGLTLSLIFLIISKFFDDVLVMDKDENVKKNRIALLTLLKEKYNHLTDFSKL